MSLFTIPHPAMQFLPSMRVLTLPKIDHGSFKVPDLDHYGGRPDVYRIRLKSLNAVLERYNHYRKRHSGYNTIMRADSEIQKKLGPDISQLIADEYTHGEKPAISVPHFETDEIRHSRQPDREVMGLCVRYCSGAQDYVPIRLQVQCRVSKHGNASFSFSYEVGAARQGSGQFGSHHWSFEGSVDARWVSENDVDEKVINWNSREKVSHPPLICHLDQDGITTEDFQQCVDHLLKEARRFVAFSINFFADMTFWFEERFGSPGYGFVLEDPLDEPVRRERFRPLRHGNADYETYSAPPNDPLPLEPPRVREPRLPPPPMENRGKYKPMNFRDPVSQYWKDHPHETQGQHTRKRL